MNAMNTQRHQQETCTDPRAAALTPDAPIAQLGRTPREHATQTASAAPTGLLKGPRGASFLWALLATATLTGAHSVLGRAFFQGGTSGPFIEPGVNVGLAFIPQAPITVTHLGAYDVDANGFAGTPEVGIFDDTQTLVTSTFLPTGTGAPLDAYGFRYAEIAPLTLPAGETYWISLAPSAVDGWLVGWPPGAQTTTTAPEILQYGGGWFGGGGLGLHFPENDSGAFGGYDAYWGPNFRFTVAVVPEPSTVGLAAALGMLGFASWRRWIRTGS